MSRTHRIGGTIVMIVAALCVVVILFGSSKSSEHPAAKAPPAVDHPVTPQPTPQPTTKEDKLTARLEIFIRAYHDISPDDTEKTHLQYVKAAAPFISRKFLPKMFFGIEEVRDPLNQRRWQKKLHVEAEMIKQEIRTYPASTSRTVYVPVSIKLVAKDGFVDQTYIRQTASQWRYNGSGNWTLMGFNEYQTGSDAL